MISEMEVYLFLKVVSFYLVLQEWGCKELDMNNNIQNFRLLLKTKKKKFKIPQITRQEIGIPVR